MTAADGLSGLAEDFNQESRQVLVDYLVASVARPGMRWMLGAGGSAVVAVVVVGVGGCWVSIA